MSKLKIIHIEDSDDDALLILRHLKKAGVDAEVKRIESSHELALALKEQAWDLVLSDFALPSFDGLAALQQIRAFDQDLPFILLSGAIGEETAVEIMKTGAKDFIMKDNLGRLVPAIEREIVEAHLRQEKRVVEQQKEKLEGQLVQAQKMEAIGTLAGGIAHDFNNILTAIIGYSELAEQELGDRPQTQRKIVEVIRAGNRAKELVQHILTFSRQKEKERKPLQIHKIVDEALKLIRASTPTTIEIEKFVSKECGLVWANPSQMHQIVMNLCTNAYHAMADDGGVLTIRLESHVLEMAEIKGTDNLPGEYACLTIQDTGCGIDTNIQEKIFDPYFTTKAQGVGTGLGLSLVLGIVQSHNGYITLESEKGRGTCVQVYLPITGKGIKPAEDNTLVKRENMPHGSEHILVVDDEPIIVQFTKEILEALGYTVTTATDGSEALDLFREAPDRFALLITDMTMPKITGVQLSEEVLKIRPNVPIILCTGHSDMVNDSIAQKVGIKEYRVKPVPGVELAQLIRKHLS